MNTVQITETITYVEIPAPNTVLVTEASYDVTIEENNSVTIQEIINTVTPSIATTVEVVTETVSVIEVGIQGPAGPAGGGGSALEVQFDGTQVDDEVELLNFSDNFIVTESSNHNINIDFSTAVLSALTLALNSLQPGADISELNNDAGYITGIGAFDTDDLDEGSTNLYFTNARAIAALALAQTVTITGNTTLDDTYSGKNIMANSASTITITIPTSLSVDFQCSIFRIGAGALAITATTPDTLNGVTADTWNIASQYRAAYLTQRAEGSFILVGDLV